MIGWWWYEDKKLLNNKGLKVKVINKQDEVGKGKGENAEGK